MDELDEARIEADALIGAFDDHRTDMDPGWPGDLARERELHGLATAAVRRVEALEGFEAHVDAAIDLTGGQR